MPALKIYHYISNSGSFIGSLAMGNVFMSCITIMVGLGYSSDGKLFAKQSPRFDPQHHTDQV